MEPRVIGYVSMGLLAVQFGIQPILFKEFASQVQSPRSLVVVCELCKLVVALVALALDGKLARIIQTWSWQESLRVSGLPALTYALQNVLIQIAYQNLPPIIFNLVNQTKLLWTAFFVFVLLGKKFSWVQCGSMAVLLFAAGLLSMPREVALLQATTDQDDQQEVLLEYPDDQNGSLFTTTTMTSKTMTSLAASDLLGSSFEKGFVPVVIASILSGFGAAVTQRAMQTCKREAPLVTLELSMYGSVFMTMSMLLSSWLLSAAAASSSSSSPSSTSSSILSLGSLSHHFEGWQMTTLIPVFSSAIGGLLVGAVTKYVGGVLKSYSLICGIALTAFAESKMYNSTLPSEVWIAAALVVPSLVMYSAFPYEEKPVVTKTARRRLKQD